jgi:hypothetical protein
MYLPPPQKNEMYRTELNIALDIKFDIYPATAGATEPGSGGLKLEPDFPAQVHVTGVYLIHDTKQEVNLVSLLSDEELESLEEDIYDALDL